jgi:hypothetical protein
MLKRSSKTKRLTGMMIDLVTGNPITEDISPIKDKNPAAVELGRLGGKKGGKARALKLTAKQRSEIASKAARARWNK